MSIALYARIFMFIILEIPLSYDNKFLFVEQLTERHEPDPGLRPSKHSNAVKTQPLKQRF